jgi:hypothetical protein
MGDVKTVDERINATLARAVFAERESCPSRSLGHVSGKGVQKHLGKNHLCVPNPFGCWSKYTARKATKQKLKHGKSFCLLRRRKRLFKYLCKNAGNIATVEIKRVS